MDAEELEVGDNIRKADGSTGEVESIEFEETSQEMYNLTVDEAHTFFVGDGQWLVHNVDCDTVLLLGYDRHLNRFRGKIPGVDILNPEWVTSGLVSEQTLTLGLSWRSQILEAIPNSKGINFIVDASHMTGVMYSGLPNDEIRKLFYFKDAATHWELDRIIGLGYENKLKLWQPTSPKARAFKNLGQREWLARWIELRQDWIYP